jgi:GntR family transcriptional regulator/MocR family aminotransferase
MTDSQTNISAASAAPRLLLDLGAALAGPLHTRLARALRDAVRDGRLAAGAALPPSRVLAAELGCSRWAVTEAYTQLAAEGYLEATVGSATRVRRLAAAPAPPGPAAAASAAPAPLDMAPGLPDLRAFPLRGWLAALRSAAADLPSADLGYPDPAGHPVLRQVLADYLGRVRGSQAGPAAVTVTTGATDAIGRLCRELRRRGGAAVAVEDPGWHRIRQVVAAAGLAVVPVPVDDPGLRADRLDDRADGRADSRADGRADAVIISPAHQFPTGTVLSAPRRAALLAWARTTGGLIIEDDYDAEFRYDRRPVGALQGAGPPFVALVGSVSKTLSPALGIGWMVTPRGWTPAPDRPDRPDRPAGPPVLDQLAFASFVRSGGYDRQLRACRKSYRDRRDALAAALAARLPEARVAGAAAGLHLLVHLPAGTDAEAVAAGARAAGVRVASLDTYRIEPGPPGLVLGYGNLAGHQVEAAVARLAAAVRSAD